LNPTLTRFSNAFTDYLKEHRAAHFHSLEKDADLERKFHLPTADIIEKLNADKEAPWVDWRYGKDGTGISPHKLGRCLSNYKINSVQEGRVRGYLFDKLKPVFERYL
jgi:hypothetical protein